MVKRMGGAISLHKIRKSLEEVYSYVAKFMQPVTYIGNDALMKYYKNTSGNSQT